MRLSSRRHIVPLSLLALLLAHRVAADDEENVKKDNGGGEASSAAEEPTPAAMNAFAAIGSAAAAESADSAMPTLPSTNTVPQACAGLRACQAVAEQETATATETGDATPTEDATAVWATKTSGGMEISTSEYNTIVLHGDSSISYWCPKKGDEWKTESLTDSLTAHTATGAGCQMEYTFTGDQIQVYGASGRDAGVFGCQVDISKDLNSTGWWNAFGTTDTFKPYQGSCQMQGLGYGKHTIQLINSPHEPQKVYFTGLRISTNKSQTVWETHTWNACCGEFTFPDGASTTVISAASATSTQKGATIAGLDNKTLGFVVVGLLVAIILSSLLIGCLCCRKRPAAASASGTSKLAEALRDDGSSRPLRRSSRRSRRSPSPSETETGDSETEESEDTEDEKPRRRKSRRR